MIDNRVHSMIIGKKGMGIRKIQQEFNVEIKLPRGGDPNPDMVIVSNIAWKYLYLKLQSQSMMNSIFPVEPKWNEKMLRSFILTLKRIYLHYFHVFLRNKW